jgi:hypothetical protein
MLLSVILQSIITAKRVLWESISRSSTPRKSQTPKSTHQIGTFKVANPTLTSEILLQLRLRRSALTVDIVR